MANQVKAWDAKLQGLPFELFFRSEKGSQLSTMANQTKAWDAKLQGLLSLKPDNEAQREWQPATEIVLVIKYNLLRFSDNRYPVQFRMIALSGMHRKANQVKTWDAKLQGLLSLKPDNEAQRKWQPVVDNSKPDESLGRKATGPELLIIKIRRWQPAIEKKGE